MRRRGFLEEEDPLDAEILLRRRGFLDDRHMDGEGSWKTLLQGNF